MTSGPRADTGAEIGADTGADPHAHGPPPDDPGKRGAAGGQAPQGHPSRRRAPPPRADDVVIAPAPLAGSPRAGQFCDLVLTGGVASGVVYPWAIVEIAREFSLRRIGGTSVGAMAGVLAAAAEYGRRHGYQNAFEPLRRAPEQLGETLPDGRTRMFSLFQPGSSAGRRLLELLAAVQEQPETVAAAEAAAEAAAGRANEAGAGDRGEVVDAGRKAKKAERRAGGAQALRAAPEAESNDEDSASGPAPGSPPRFSWLRRGLRSLARLYWPAALLGAALGAEVAFLLGPVWSLLPSPGVGWIGCGPEASSRCATWITSLAVAAALVAGITGALLGALVGVVLALLCDFRVAIVNHHFGLCHGASTDPAGATAAPGLTDWLHEGIQRSAGRGVDDPPLTFRDLWRAPLAPQAREHGRDASGERAIDLQVITTNLTHMRPYRLPLDDLSSRLFFDAADLAPLLPAAVLAALVHAARPYAPRHPNDPPAPTSCRLYELPRGDLPLVVAARLSLSYPLLFTAVPLYAIDEESRPQRRGLRRCWFSDGGLCSNFPMHLFDSALPRWPTFGLWLDERNASHERQAVWLPRRFHDGRSDAWRRFGNDGCPSRRQGARGTRWSDFGGFLGALLATAKDWADRTALRMPHTRHRVARIALRRGEGQLNIAMSRGTLLRMAREYGTRAGRQFVRRYAFGGADSDARGVRPDWDRQRLVRLMITLRSLRDLLRGLARSAAGSPLATPVHELLDQAQKGDLLGSRANRLRPLSPGDAQALREALDATVSLEARLTALPLPATLAGEPEPELRLRPPV